MNGEDIHNLLNDEIERELDDIAGMETGSKEKNEAIIGLMALYDRRIQENKTTWDADDKDERRKMEMDSNAEELKLKNQQLEQDYQIKLEQLNEQIAHRQMEEAIMNNDVSYKEQQTNEQRIDRYVKIGIAAAELLVPIAAYSVWYMVGLCHERDNSFSLTTVKELLKNMRPTKK
jgi:hypothetical protein